MGEYGPLYLIPFRLVITQSLLIVVAIALESVVLRRLLKYPPRKSVEYSTSLNLFSLVIGWFFFLNIIGNLPLPLQVEQDLINLILYDRWSNSTLAWAITIGLITFFGTFFVEAIGFTSLKRVHNEEEALENQINRTQKRTRQSSGRYTGLFSFGEQGNTDPLYAILLANAASYTAILGILCLLRFGSNFFAALTLWNQGT